MPSSISSSNERLPQLPWLRVWALTLFVTVGLLLSYEMIWRWRGFRPAIKDDLSLWMKLRNSVLPHEKNELVLLGASQSQSNFDIATLEKELGFHVTQLAVYNSSSLPTLEHFANDDSFVGTLLVDVIFWTCYEGMYPSAKDEVQASYLAKWQSKAAVWWLESEIASSINRVFAFRQDALRPTAIFNSFAKKKWPVPPIMRPTEHRELKYHFTPDDVRSLSSNEKMLPFETARFYADLPKLRERVQRIIKRGGKVYFIMHPTTGDPGNLNLNRFPRDRFFDKLISETGATAGIHFLDEPSIREFIPPDGSHLEQSDAIPYSKAIAAILKRK